MALVLAGVLMLAGCTANSGVSEGGSDGFPAPAPAEDSGGGVPGVVGGDEDGADRDVIVRGQLSITVESPIEAVDDAIRIVERAGGRIDQRTERPPVDGDGGAAQLVARIPSVELTSTLDDIEALGDVESVQISASDVTVQSQDLNARITALRASVDRLLALLATATTTSDLIEIETALSTRQSELESLEAQQRALDDQIDFATVSIDFGSQATAPVDEPENFLSGIIAGWDALVGFLAGTLVVIGVLLPWLALAAILTVLTLLVLRRRRHRRAAVNSTMEA